MAITGYSPATMPTTPTTRRPAAGRDEKGDAMGVFKDLGKALRWLRTRQDRKQYEIAEAAGITKAMLSAYETGKQNPSIETLEKIMSALGADLRDLDHALSVNQSGAREPAERSRAWSSYQRQRSQPYRAAEPRDNIYRVLDLDRPLPAEQELALSQMLAGYHSLLRQMYGQLEEGRQVAEGGLSPDDGGE